MNFKDKLYYSALAYRGRNGQIVNLSYKKHGRWWRHTYWYFSFNSVYVFGPFKSKFGALLGAAHLCKMSGKAINWVPIKGIK